MIIWIASYPKSGNTWVRSLLSAYLYSKDGVFDFKLLKKIDQFPSKKYFDSFSLDFKDIKKVSEYWIVAQDRINLLNKEITFFKTHSALCKLENNVFTNKNNTKAAIYIVRDPRNLISSFSHHFSMNLNDSYDFIINKNKITSLSKWGTDGFGVATILGNWSEHYKSWKTLSFAPKLIVKYEDLLIDTKRTFEIILNFLSKVMDVEFDNNKISNAVDSCRFENLQNKERIEGFSESISSSANGEKKNFFYLGKENNWKKLLDPKIEEKIRIFFNKEMKELNYIR